MAISDVGSGDDHSCLLTKVSVGFFWCTWRSTCFNVSFCESSFHARKKWYKYRLIPAAVLDKYKFALLNMLCTTNQHIATQWLVTKNTHYISFQSAMSLGRYAGHRKDWEYYSEWWYSYPSPRSRRFLALSLKLVRMSVMGHNNRENHVNPSWFRSSAAVTLTSSVIYGNCKAPTIQTVKRVNGTAVAT